MKKKLLFAAAAYGAYKLYQRSQRTPVTEASEPEEREPMIVSLPVDALPMPLATSPIEPSILETQGPAKPPKRKRKRKSAARRHAAR